MKRTSAETMMGMLPDRMRASGLDPSQYEFDAFAYAHEENTELPWLGETDDVVWLEQLTADRPGIGMGRRIMAEACMLADETGCRIALNPWAQPREGGLAQDRLETFYQSLGFGWRQDHVMVREPEAPTVVNVRYDVPYLPLPNRVELVFDATGPRNDLTMTSFVMPVTEEDAVVMANNRRRKMEVPGGHIDPGENQERAARREGHEETGCLLAMMIILGHLRMISRGQAPTGWRYPHPLGYQSFFASRVTRIEAYVENDECLTPSILTDITTLKPHVQLIARRARWLVSRAEGGQSVLGSA